MQLLLENRVYLPIYSVNGNTHCVWQLCDRRRTVKNSGLMTKSYHKSTEIRVKVDPQLMAKVDLWARMYGSHYLWIILCDCNTFTIHSKWCWFVWRFHYNTVVHVAPKYFSSILCMKMSADDCSIHNQCKQWKSYSLCIS